MLASVFAAGDEVLLEPVLPGREVTCGILGEEALPPILIEPLAGDFFDYKSKYASDGARELCPAPIGPELTALAQQFALPLTGPWGLRGTAGPTSPGAGQQPEPAGGQYLARHDRHQPGAA